MNTTSRGPGRRHADNGVAEHPLDQDSPDSPMPPKVTLSGRGWLAALVGIAVSVCVVAGLFWAGFAIDHALTGVATFTSHVNSYHPTDNGHLIVSISVRNTGNEVGVPSCRVTVASSASADDGGTTLIGRSSIDPGRAGQVSGPVIVSDQDASAVNLVKATC